jgi:ferredoxin--NADP+ reductase
LCLVNDFSRQRLFIFLQTHSITFHDKPQAAFLSLDLKTKNACFRNRQIICQSVQQAGIPKVAVSPLNFEDDKEPPLNTYKPKEPYTATIVSVERIVGPKAPGETCHIVIDHGGNVPYWEGQSYGVIPPVSD